MILDAEKTSQPSPVVNYAVTQSLAEIALGSIVHTFKIPLGGHLLSLNQGLLLIFASKHARNRKTGISIASRMANTAAVLKALSPTGNRLTPMLAISMQGFLYSIGLAFFGMNLIGATVGTMLLSVWGFAQPLLLGWLIFGSALWGGVEKLWTEVARALSIPLSHGIWILAACVAAKLLIAAGVALAAWRSKKDFEREYLEKLDRWSMKAVPTPSRAQIAGPLRELRNPWFLLALALSLGFFIATAHPDAIQVGLFLLRISAGSLLVFWGLRKIPSAWLEARLNHFPHLKSTVDQARAKLSRI